jgi:hypothetical protein
MHEGLPGKPPCILLDYIAFMVGRGREVVYL